MPDSTEKPAMHNPEAVANALISLIMFNRPLKLKELLKDAEVRDYLANMQDNDSVLLKLKAYRYSAKSILHILAEFLPRIILESQFKLSVKPLIFARMQRNANTLLYLNTPQDLVHKIFTYLYTDEQHGMSNQDLLVAAKGARKCLL